MSAAEEVVCANAAGDAPGDHAHELKTCVVCSATFCKACREAITGDETRCPECREPLDDRTELHP